MSIASIAPIAEHRGAEELERIYRLQRESWQSSPVTTLAERRGKIKRLLAAVMRRQDDIRTAMREDFRKPAAEVDLTEIYFVLLEGRHTLRHLRRWMKPRRVGTPLALLGSRSAIQYQPKGVVLILSPWNFPFNLSLGPLISAIAAGNRVILKPSELTPHSSRLMRELIAEVFDPSEAVVLEGDATVAQALLAKKFDHIFFTGSPRVGKLVMKAAAEHLTSITLELGGKSPVIVDESADLDETARKLAWGKFVNGGQTCIAPDYVLVHESVRPRLVEKLGKRIEEMYGGSPVSSDDYAAMVSDGHAQRLRRLYEEAVRQGARVVSGGVFEGRSIAPTILDGVSPQSEVMTEEIFGPILPVMGYRDLGEAIQFIRERENPLALYLFSRDDENIERVLTGTTAGGTCVNDTLIHFFQLNLPFGGSSYSGMGRSHGFAGFESFSNTRGVLRQPWPWSGIQLMYPPYSKRVRKLIDFTMRYL